MRNAAVSTTLVGITAVLLASTPPGWAQDEWPPAPRLEPAVATVDATSVPPSVHVEPLGQDRWHCTFRYRPPRGAGRVVLAGTFNEWDRDALPMQGPDTTGSWTASVELSTGIYQYKFLVDNEEWMLDTENPDRTPDGYGGYNSVLRLGRLAQLKESPARLGDGQIDVAGLAHQPPAPLYIQPVNTDELAIRYRTLSHDVEHVYVARKGGGLTKMEKVCEGPVFTYWEAQLAIPAQGNRRAPNVRAVEYTFVLDDGAGRLCDPYPSYYYTFTSDSLIDVPDWAPDAVWYEIFVDRFRNGDTANDPDPVRKWTSEWFTPADWEGKDGQTFYQNYVFERYYGGDLAGIEAKLPYLKELGVNTLCLTPVFKAPTYHKFDVQNFVHIDDHFGVRGDYASVEGSEDLLDPDTWQWTESDKRFLAFVERAHEAGFRVVLEAVFNHVGAEHPAFKDVLKHGKRSRYADWFEVTSWQPFAYKGWQGYAHMPLFRKSRYGFASAGVKQHLFDITRRWMDPNQDGNPADGIDGWRVDVPHDIPRPFWAEWGQLVKEINPNALITGEVWHRGTNWVDGEHFDTVMNYEFAREAVAWIFNRQNKATADVAAPALTELLLSYPAAANPAVQNLISSHDTDRLASMAHNPDREFDRQNRVQDNNPNYDNSKPDSAAYQRARLAAFLQMTFVGAPMVYYGDEVGMWGADDPSNRKPMLWKDLEPYELPEENRVMDDHLEFYQQAIALRHAHSALRNGAYDTLLTDEDTDVWVFSRVNDNEQLLVALNPSDQAQTVHVPLPRTLPGSWKGVWGDQNMHQASNGLLSVSVPAVGAVVLQAQP